jgi:hypothetical protein
MSHAELHRHVHGISADDPCYGYEPTVPLPTSAWIDPQGGFHPVTDAGHARWVEFVYLEKFPEQNENEYDPEDYRYANLEKKGWTHLSFGNLIYDREPNQRQLDTLWDTLQVYKEAAYERINGIASMNPTRRLEDALNALFASKDSERAW